VSSPIGTLASSEWRLFALLRSCGFSADLSTAGGRARTTVLRHLAPGARIP
jgi:hypothetical protein